MLREADSVCVPAAATLMLTSFAEVLCAVQVSASRTAARASTTP
ncbi:hypothetical protein LDDCCGHA_1322 [Methylobacterium oxalidis]|nr:hypothetical protein LDDCCGHA_1322 [Methylobacterium oxalidis]